MGKKDQNQLVPEDDKEFTRFWDSYPKRVAKKEARRAWWVLKPTHETVDKMIAALEWQCRSAAWVRDGGQYIPYPASWLRAERWDDEPVGVPQVNEKTARRLVSGNEFVAGGRRAAS